MLTGVGEAPRDVKTMSKCSSEISVQWSGLTNLSLDWSMAALHGTECSVYTQQQTVETRNL